MDRRDAMALSGSGSYYIQRGISGSGPPTQPTFHGSQGVHPLSNSNSPFGSNPGGSAGFGSPPLSAEHSPAAVPPHVGMNMVAPPPGEAPVKRKRGRPRKYGQDGSVSLALSPSVSTMTPNPNKRRRGRPPGSGRKQRLASIGELMPSSSGMSFTPHVITVSVGEDIAAKVSAFSQQGPRAICILSASGAVSTATLHQSSSSPATITYEGRFEILSLSASYLVTIDGSYRNRAGNLSVSLASPDGRVIGGGIGGTLYAYGMAWQVIVGSFIWATSKVKSKKREDEASEVVQDTDDQALDNNTVPPLPQPSQNIIPTSVGMWSTGSRPMDMRHAHMDIDLMRG
ncbi:PREDICTED: AT-hook motif nuclear-localized protein 9-like [Tarenaya hassleriana]|uniref:AT-hook motif nuclear-localized protein 9-like n=1 Tax=Tarenaya hassleriana TaxID=28532 RepID=UPI00053C845A|nr:PREDICTED: AT-hook motif nuclear-localized protein 9-like [Tarenaya hassleriana]